MTGWPIPGIALRVVDVEGRDVRPDGEQIGEIVVRSNTVMDGYYRDPEGTATALRDGWLHTGDIGTLDADGYLRITDRKKDIIKSGGEWISSVDLENALMAHPAVKEAAVIAMLNEKWGERPLAVIVPKDGAQVSADELRSFLEPNFAKWWLPDAIVFTKEIPRTATGKFSKLTLREQYANYRPPPGDLPA